MGNEALGVLTSSCFCKGRREVVAMLLVVACKRWYATKITWFADQVTALSRKVVAEMGGQGHGSLSVTVCAGKANVFASRIVELPFILVINKRNIHIYIHACDKSWCIKHLCRSRWFPS
jgi:hypothetical protein